MQKSRNTDRFIKRARSNVNRSINIGLLCGIFLFALGLLFHLSGGDGIGINLKTLQPTINNGSIFIVLGIALTIGSLLSVKNKTNLIKLEQERLIKKMNDKKTRFNHMQ